MNPRLHCHRCLRPLATCYCSWLQSIAMRTRFVILMHEDERRRPIATGRMSHLSLENSELLIGNEVDQSARVQQLIAQGACYLLYPGQDSVACADVPIAETRTIFILDGKWGHSRQMLRANPLLAALPRISFTGCYESWFTIKRQPQRHCLSTLEAIAYTIVELSDEDPVQALKLLPPYFQVINQQLRFEHGPRLE